MIDRLQTEGIFAQGYGLIAKAPMLDPRLSISAKAIYAYLCSLAGNGNTAFPSRDKLVSVLDINKDTYYKHLEQLTSLGYLKITKNFQKGHQFANNIFTIVTDLEVPEERMKTTKHRLYSTIKAGGILKLGYGMIARSVMSADNISHKAKALYAYFCSFAGAGESAWPGKQATLYYLDISGGTYNKLLRELTEQNYLRVEQRVEKGRFSVCDYILVDKPVKISDTEKPDMEKPDTKKPDAGKSDKRKPDAQKPDAGKSDSKNRDATINSPSNNSSVNISFPNISLSNADGLTDEEKNELVEWTRTQGRGGVEHLLRQQLMLDILPDQQLEYLADLMTDACYFKDLKGLPPMEFIPKLLCLSREECQFVLNSVSQVSGIHNLKAYYLACLLSAHEDYEAAIEQEVRADQANGLI